MLVDGAAAMEKEAEQICEGKECPICIQALPLSEFGICRARKDGRNLYCKSCIRRKVSDSRRLRKEYKTAHHHGLGEQFINRTLAAGVESHSPSLAANIAKPNKMTPVERVREA